MPGHVDDPPGEIEGLEPDALSDVDDSVWELVEAIQTESDSSLRLAVQYMADEYEVLFARDNITDQFPGPELEQRIETLVMKGLADPPQEASLFDFGTLEATVRLYEHAHVMHVPYRDWSGLVFVFDRQATPIVDLMSEHLVEN